METFRATDPAVVAGLLAVLVLVLVAGGAAALRGPVAATRVASWALLVGGTLGVERLTAGEPPGLRMLALIALAMLVFKMLVVVEERASGMETLPFGAWLGFAAGWPGMQPRLFARPRRGPLRGARSLLVRGAIHLALGTLLVFGARLAWASTHSRLLATALALPGLSLVLHFGMCNLLAAAWRTSSVACDELFRAPLRARSLSEFWGRRWNLAFSGMTASVAYRPLSGRLGRGPALMASFLLSGLLHELAISLPVRAGFGLPLLYFALQGALVTAERDRARAGRAGSARLRRIVTFAALLLPLPILFHRPFLAGVIWPLIGIGPGA